MTTTYQKQREEFITRMIQDFPNTATIDKVRLILRHAKTHGNLAVMQCNAHPAMEDPRVPIDIAARAQDIRDKWIAKREAMVERRIKQLCDEIGVPVTFGGDPRGYTVKVKLPSGRYNTWGGSEDGWGVPQG